MKRPLILLVIFAALAAACAPSGQQQPSEVTPTTPRSGEVPEERRSELEQKFCQAALAYLETTSEQAPQECKGVVMRRSDQFGGADTEGYLVTVIVGAQRDKIELGAVVDADDKVELRSIRSDLERAAAEKASIDIYNLQNMVDAYYIQAKPSRLPDTLEALTQPPNEMTPRIPLDPWGHSYIYEKQSKTDYVIFSAGPDGEPGTIDDVRVD